MSSVVETSVNRTLQFQSGPPRLAEQEHRDMLRSLAVVLTVCFALWLHPKYHKKKAWVAPGRQSPSRTAIVPQKQAIFSVSMPKNKASRTKTAIVTEKPADSSVTMTRKVCRKFLLPVEVSVLLRCEGVDFAAPESEFAACNLLIDFQRHIVYHAARLAAHLVAVFNEIFCTEGLDGE